MATCHRPSLLLQVNREAKQAALDFYRVHIPCNDNSRIITAQTPRCIYLNPKFDILHIKTEGTSRNFVDFVHDVKAYDPQGYGISNLAVGDQEQNHLILPSGI